MNEVVNLFINYIDFIYILVCNTITYLTLQVIEFGAKKPVLPRWEKRVVSAISAIILGVIMVRCYEHPSEAVFYGFFLQFLSWDYFFKPLVERIKRFLSTPTIGNEEDIQDCDPNIEELED